jgi:hypothetical protein
MQVGQECPQLDEEHRVYKSVEAVRAQHENASGKLQGFSLVLSFRLKRKNGKRSLQKNEQYRVKPKGKKMRW